MSETVLLRMYEKEGKSMQDIADTLECSLHKVKYWMEKYGIEIRSIADAMYLKHNPDGDPFTVHLPKTLKEAKLFGLGVGLYWGEGTKADTSSIRLGNTDPKLIKKFMEFLMHFFSIKKSDLHFGLQIFSDIKVEDALDFWIQHLKIDKRQFYKPTVTRSGSIGTYRKKSQYGVLTVHYHNRKLRDILVSLLPT